MRLAWRERGTKEELMTASRTERANEVSEVTKVPLLLFLPSQRVRQGGQFVVGGLEVSPCKL